MVSGRGVRGNVRKRFAVIGMTAKSDNEVFVVNSRDAVYFDFFMYSHSYSFADLSTPNPLLKSIYSKNRHLKLELESRLTRKVDASNGSLGIVKLIFEDLKYLSITACFGLASTFDSNMFLYVSSCERITRLVMLVTCPELTAIFSPQDDPLSFSISQMKYASRCLKN